MSTRYAVELEDELAERLEEAARNSKLSATELITECVASRVSLIYGAFSFRCFSIHVYFGIVSPGSRSVADNLRMKGVVKRGIDPSAVAAQLQRCRRGGGHPLKLSNQTASDNGSYRLGVHLGSKGLRT
jgi:hypothetical protein